ncbi:outer membrane receptor for ferrienterochelin and colicins [Paracoccus solventivorans]|uniref:Outer membrane receptor for ferrienterochelin and colicins n=1 Tax=Paracoccus solventivorans TaxID=53463 RepID=A0A1M7GXR3_9RHOB|nr:TonB-dependent receptor [Paracoccus solventivorans]SHM21045.1 outer membrane receptor for ferrienterochelin and colicins [Paracoccus solventivorans]
MPSPPVLPSLPSGSRSRLRVALLSLTALSSPALVLAQETPDQIVLDPIYVTSASSIATSVQDAPASITVIDQSEILASGGRSLNDVLRRVPGLNLTRSNDGNSQVSFRGLSSSRTLTLVDGKRISSRNTFARHYQGDLQNVPLDAIERIEVVRGPMSTLYGSDAMGGVINIITKKNTEVWSGSLTTEFGFADESTTADNRSISAYVSGPLGENLSMSAWGKIAETEAPDEPYAYSTATPPAPLFSTNGIRTKALGARLSWTPLDGQEWGLEAQTSVDNYLDDLGGPDSNEVTKNSIALNHDWTLGTGSVSSYLRYETSENQSWNTTTSGWNDPIEYDTLTLESRYTSQTSIGGRTLDYTLGGLVAHEKLSDPQTTANALIEGSVDTAAIYAEGRYQATEALSLTSGLRVDHHERFGTHVTPRIYANYDFGNGLMLKAGYSQAFVAPDLRNLNPNYQMGSRGNGCKPYRGPCTIIGNPDLQPETSDNFEIGLNYQGERTSWEVTAFYNDVENMISARRTDEVAGNDNPIFVRDNFDYGKTAGVEFGLDHQLSDDLTWVTSGTYIAKSEFKYGDFDTAYPMATTPKWNVTTGLDWQTNDRLKLSGDVTYVGKQAGYVVADGLVVGEGEQASVPAGQNSKAYFLVNVAAAYDLTDSATLNFGIDNLFDDQPESDVDYREDGRVFTLGVTTRF